MSRALLRGDETAAYRVKVVLHWPDTGQTRTDYFGPYGTLRAARAKLTAETRPNPYYACRVQQHLSCVQVIEGDWRDVPPRT